MILGGFQKLTLIDFPGKVATTVFTAGCNFRCPFCHNPELVAGPFPAGSDAIERDFFAHLEKRKGKLDGVCITGGEPTIQRDLADFIRKIKTLGYAVKLDTNGLRPDAVRELLNGKLLDFIAMDIKNRLERYDETVGVKVDKERIRLSVELVRNSGLPYEFRTTAVPGIHTEADFLAIADWIDGAESYYFQRYRSEHILDEKLKNRSDQVELDLEAIGKKIGGRFAKFGIRG